MPSLFPLLLCALLPIEAHAKRELVSQEGLVAAWLFNEGKGTNAEDASSGAHHANFTGGNPQWVKGKFGSALRFNGKSDQADTISPVVVDTVDFTLGLWVKPEAIQKKWANIVSSHQDSPNRGISIEMVYEYYNNFHSPIGDGRFWNGDNDHFATLKAGEWQHFVIRRSATKIEYLLNGKLVSSFNGTNRPVAPATANFRFGNWILNEDRYFHGDIDEVFLAKRALSNAELEAIRTKGLSKALGLKKGRK